MEKFKENLFSATLSLVKRGTVAVLCLMLTGLFLVAGCKKDTSSSAPPDQPEPVKKYLAKVSLVGKDSTLYEVERCTWDSLNRLKTFEYNFGSIHSFDFHYDSIGRVSRIDGYDPFYGHFHLLCDWKNDKELNGMDYYTLGSSGDSPPSRLHQYTYLYDELHRYVEIKRFYVLNDNNRLDYTWNIAWDEYNITSVYAIPEVGPEHGIFGHLAFDNKHNPYNEFPNMLIQTFNDRVIAYNPSKNNFIKSKYEYDYDYDKDNYPLRQYDILEDGTRILRYVFEYYE
ncbi:MAG: hypothetical protein FWG84_02740 [Bacteroidales bacterium]|nr:hypothetical protein [Bacteroidales bacterium]